MDGLSSMNRETKTRWSSKIAFIFAASAAAIGLGNIWRFPYMTGQNGGSAFVLTYLICVVLLGIPLLIVEIVVGRIGRYNPAKTMTTLALEFKQTKYWGLIGGLTILAGYLILTYYVVIVGWVIDYTFRAALGEFKHATESTSLAAFKALQHSHWQMLLTDTIVILCAIGINILGIKRGLERAVMIIFPVLLILLFLLLGYAATINGFNEGVSFLFKPDFSKLSAETILLALGQAFFSLNIAMGITMMFSVYLSEKTSIPSVAISIAVADTGFALLAGLIIFPIVFEHHLMPGAGPSLIFQTLPIAFGKMIYGSVIATLFFLMLFFAAFSSVIALLEPSISWLMETRNITRARAVTISASFCWILSLGTIASFSIPKHFQLFGITFFQAIDFITASIMLPIGGFFIAIFGGWILSKHFLINHLNWKINFWFRFWKTLLSYFAPIAILFILLASTGLL